MDFKSMLQTMTSLSEAEGSRVHKGTYGTSHGKEDVRDQYGHKVGKIDKGAEAQKDAPKKGRGRPKKDGGEESKFDTSALSGVFGGKKPSGKVGTVSKKHSLKEYMEEAATLKRFESVMEGMFGGGVDHASVAANLSKLARVIKSVQTPEQFAVAQKYAQRMKGTIMNHQHDKMGFGSGLRANLGVMRDVDADMKAKAAELGIEYNALEEGDQIEIKPASQTNTQVIQQGNKTLGTVNNPQLANQIKQSIGKGEMTFAGDEQQMAEGKKPDFLDVDKDGDKKESFKKAVSDKKKVKESRDHSSSEYLDEEVAKILAREKPGMATVKSNDDFYSAIYHELVQLGLTPRAARGKLMDEDFISDVASAYNQYQANPTLDENSISDFTQHALAEPTNNFRTQGQQPGSMAAPRGAKTEINRPVAEPTPWGTDPIAAATDRAFNFVSSLGKGTKFTKEGTEMKDIQLESWEQQLNGLLTEGITVSSSQGQQGAPDSVSVTANDADAEALLSVLRNAGIGGFGAEPQAPEIGYGVAQGGEEEFNGTGTEPQASPEVVGDDGDMLSMLKKMAGLSAGPVGGSEEGQDYQDEEGSEEQAQTLEPTTGGEESSEESSEEDSEEEEVTDEGNKFTGNLAKAREQGKEEADLDGDGDMEKVKEGEDNCNECGMVESSCGCAHDSVEESFANEPGHGTTETELAKLKALLSMGNDMHRVKQSQAMGNPVRVAESDALSQWKKLSGI